MFNFNLSKGILGINARNLLYIRPYNKKKAIRLADSKLKTKHFLSARGVPVPKLYGVIRNVEELEKFDFNTLSSHFVLKPNCGYGGEGIIPITSLKGDIFTTVSGNKMTKAQIIEHINDILDGRFSITGSSDTAFFEQMIICDERVAKFSYKGLPDIRVVLHNLIPVMAMLRLPTAASNGKANLHQGAIAVGIDIAKGVATHVIENNKIIEGPPGLRGFEIPYWDEILLISSKVQLMTNLGYLAVDIALDKTVGPILLEVNARAGLSVQIANLAPLRKRLERIKGVKVATPEKGVRIAQDMFGNKVEKDIKNISGKAVVGEREMIDIITKDGITKILASINPVVEGSILDQALAKSLDLIHEEPTSDEKLKLKFNMANIRVQTMVSLEDLSKKDYKIIIGKRDLQSFLVDPSRKYKDVSKMPKFGRVDSSGSKVPQINYSLIDSELTDIDKQIKLLYHLRPVNLEEEKEAFLRNQKRNPNFVYPDLRFDPFRMREKLKTVKCDVSPLGQIFAAKRDEILKKLSLVEHIGTDSFTAKSIELFSRPDEELVKAARTCLEEKPNVFPEEKLDIDYLKAGEILGNVLKTYGLTGWKVKFKESMVADCMAGKRGTLFIRKGAMFSEYRIKLLIAHEIETHIFTAENGSRQPYRIFNNGLAGYLETQEGLAVRNQMSVLEYDFEKNFWPALSVLAINEAFSMPFIKVVEYVRDLGFGLARAWSVATRVKRGFEDTGLHGAFTKDAVYFKGFVDIKNFESGGGNLKELYYGKFRLKDLNLVKKVPNLVEPKFLPKWL